jgi:hypothetical protein
MVADAPKEGMSFEEIGEKIGMTPERARQIYNEAIAKIQRALRKNPELAEALFTHLENCGRRNLRYPKIPEVIEREPDC